MNQQLTPISVIKKGDCILCNNNISIILHKGEFIRMPRKNLYFCIVRVFIEKYKKEATYIYMENDKCMLLPDYNLKVCV